MVLEYEKLNLKSKIEQRVKAQNSMQYKISKYTSSDSNGEIPIHKCLNDIYGIRIIVDHDIEYNAIKKFIEEKFSGLKCIDSSKKEYKAVHVYFKIDNYTFPRELQIWNIKNEQTNKISHKKYKQEYTKWEQENKKEVRNS